MFMIGEICWRIFMMTSSNGKLSGLLALCGIHRSPVTYSDIIMCATASQITSLTIVCSNVYSTQIKKKHQSSASLTFVRGIHRWLVNSRHKGPVTRKMFLFDDVMKEFPSQRPIALMSSVTSAWTNGWVNNRDASDLRCHRAHYEVIVMCFVESFCSLGNHVRWNVKTVMFWISFLKASFTYSFPSNLMLWDRANVIAILKTTITDAFSWMKISVFFQGSNSQ